MFRSIRLSVLSNHIFILFYFIAVGRAKKDNNYSENKPLVIAKPIVVNDNKLQTVNEIVSNETNETPASG